jgi:bifunctional non-homologous end joining protein LigD
MAAIHFIEPELATLAEHPPEGGDWIHEAKLDGYRIEALVSRGRARLLTRNGNDWTDRFPTVAAALAELPTASAVIDGEVVALGERGISSFQRLQRAGDSSPAIVFYVFDLLRLDRVNLTGRPFADRRRGLLELLRRAGPGCRVLRPVEQFEAAKGDPLAQACRRGLEGVVSKLGTAPYRSGRTRDWIKSKCANRQEFVIIGFTAPRGSRAHLGALLLAVSDRDGELRYAGKVGTGFDRPTLARLAKRLEPLVRKTPPIPWHRPARVAGLINWVTPRLVAEVRFTEWTADGRIRHPAFVGLREDKPPVEVHRE